MGRAARRHQKRDKDLNLATTIHDNAAASGCSIS
jgi:hypothetical protein